MWCKGRVIAELELCSLEKMWLYILFFYCKIKVIMWLYSNSGSRFQRLSSPETIALVDRIEHLILTFETTVWILSSINCQGCFSLNPVPDSGPYITYQSTGWIYRPETGRFKWWKYELSRNLLLRTKGGCKVTKTWFIRMEKMSPPLKLIQTYKSKPYSTRGTTSQWARKDSCNIFFYIWFYKVCIDSNGRDLSLLEEITVFVTLQPNVIFYRLVRRF